MLPPDSSALRLAAIVNSSEDAIVSKSLDSVIQTWNPAAERMFGYTAAEAVGRSVRIIIPPERQQEEDMVLARIRSGDTVQSYETVRLRKDGSRVEVSLTVSPIRNANGVVIGASKIVRDISEQMRLFRELEMANRLKDDFLGTLSHELRTPLNAILGYTQIMQRPGITEQRKARALDIVARNAKALAQLVSDVLDLSTVTAGKTSLNIRHCDLVTVLDAAIDVIRPAADAKGLRVERDVAVDGAPVSGDPDRLQQVFWNLLSNAVKFTPRGGTITATLIRAPTEVRVDIADTGVGIAPDFLPHVFQRFRRAHYGATREFGGLGLGLSLVRQFVELHGGTVSVSSEGLGRGARFTVTLPVQGPENLGSVTDAHPGSIP